SDRALDDHRVHAHRGTRVVEAQRDSRRLRDRVSLSGLRSDHPHPLAGQLPRAMVSRARRRLSRNDGARVTRATQRIRTTSKGNSMADNRLERIDAEHATEAHKKVIARLGEGRGRIPTPFNIWLHNPRLAEGMEIIGTHVDHSPVLSEAESEVAILST